MPPGPQNVPVPQGAIVGLPGGDQDGQQGAPTWRQRLLSAVRGAAPTAAAIAATAADPLIAPATAPAAYWATKGLIEPEEIAEHPYRSAAEAGAMGLPIPTGRGARAAGRTILRAAGRHPLGARIVGTGTGMLAGSALRGMGNEGLAVGEMGGAWMGHRLGGDVASAGAKQLEREAVVGPGGDPALAEETTSLRDAIAGATGKAGGGTSVDPTGLPSLAESVRGGGRLIQTPAERASEKGLWHAGMGEVPEPGNPEQERLIERLKRAGVI